MKLVSVNIWNKFSNVLYILEKFQNKGVFKILPAVINSGTSGRRCISDSMHLMNHQALLTTFKCSQTCSIISFTANMSVLATVSISFGVLRLLFKCSSVSTLAPFWWTQPKVTRMTFPKCNMGHGIIFLKSLPLLFIALGIKFQILNTEHEVWYALAVLNLFFGHVSHFSLIFRHTLPYIRFLPTRAFIHAVSYFWNVLFPCLHLVKFLLIIQFQS